MAKKSQSPRQAKWLAAVDASVRARFEEELNHLAAFVDEMRVTPTKSFKSTGLGRRAGYWMEPDPPCRYARAALASVGGCTKYKDDKTAVILLDVLAVLLRRNLPFTVDDIDSLIEAGGPAIDHAQSGVLITGIVGAIERIVGSQSLEPRQQKALAKLAGQLAKMTDKKKPQEKLLARLNALCDDSTVARLHPDEGWADDLRAWIGTRNDKDRENWEALLRDAAATRPESPATQWQVEMVEADPNYLNDQADSNYLDNFDAVVAKRSQMQFERLPSADWSRLMKTHLEKLGQKEIVPQLERTLHKVASSKPGMLVRTSLNRELMRGLLWYAAEIGTAELAQALQHAAKYFYANNSPLAEAAVCALHRMGTPSAAGALSAIASTLTKDSQRTFVESAVERLSSSVGVGPEEIADGSIPTFQFTEVGRLVKKFGDVQAILEVRSTRDVETTWTRSDGTELKTIPAKTKREFATEIEAIKTTVKGVKEAISGLVARLEGSWLAQTSYRLSSVQRQLIDHVVGGIVGRKLIWRFDIDRKIVSAMWQGDRWADVRGRRIAPSDSTTATLWHPLDAAVDEVLAWRERLDELAVQQPFKQAYREIYTLSDAERATRIYSNRFAAHIIRQAQFRQLAKTRGWKVGLVGPWDSGDEQHPERKLPRWRLRAEFWVHGAGDEFQTGFTYVATDQVRFYQAAETEPLPLENIPPLVFSEVMRDVDLFVSVASVGNNPEWSDGGPGGQYRDYWQQYSFGELGATAQTRRTLLETLIPRLKIAKRCKLLDRFLQVKGELHTYKIHFGSGNILMSPNDRYLCIVPKQVDGVERVFLPFEGDGTLSVILSKAFMLAEDTKINDPTIVSQLKK